MEPIATFSYEQITEGMTCERDYCFTRSAYENFIAGFDDRSPIHVDSAYAEARGFRGRVMHGGMLNGFVSHFIGMVFPGASSLLLSVDLRFLQPSYLDDIVQLQAKVAQKSDVQRVVVLHVGFLNKTRGYAVASGRIQVKIRAS